MTSERNIDRAAYEAERARHELAFLSLDIERKLNYRDPVIIYILACAHRETVDAFKELAQIEPTDVDKIRLLQNKIERYSEIGAWLEYAVTAGAQAAREMEPDVYDGWLKSFSSSDEE